MRAARRRSHMSKNRCTRLRRAGFPPRRKRRGFQPEDFMNGFQAVKKIRARKPHVFIVGVTSNPDLTKRFTSAGGDAALLRSGNEIAELVEIISRGEGSA
jgi:DNA-binding NarL/FixJ family response regulator